MYEKHVANITKIIVIYYIRIDFFYKIYYYRLKTRLSRTFAIDIYKFLVWDFYMILLQDKKDDTAFLYICITLGGVI